MFNHSTYQPYATIGTTPPIFIPRDPKDTNPKTVRPGENYFYVKIKDAQAAFTGPVWEQASQLLVTSQVSLNHPSLGYAPILAIRQLRQVKRNQAEKLGLSPNLIDLVPAVMSHISISIEFVLDKKNRLFNLAALINHSAFIAAVSLAPGAAVTACTIGGLSQQFIQTFLKPEDQELILQFTGNFNIPGGELRDGYYVILGSSDTNNPLPYQLQYPNLKLDKGELRYNNKRVTQLSYVILEVCCLPVRGRALNEGARWEDKLCQAEAMAEPLEPFDDQEEKDHAWRECKKLLKEAELFLQTDANYLPDEAKKILRTTFAHCWKQIFEQDKGLRTRERGPHSEDEQELIEREKEEKEEKEYAEWVKSDLLAESTSQPDDRAFLGIAPDEDLQAAVECYTKQVAETQRILEKEKMD